MYKTVLQIRGGRRGWSAVNCRQNLVFHSPYWSCNDHCDRWLFQKIFFIFDIYFLEILLKDLELVFLEFKHIYKTQRAKFSFCLFIFYSLYKNGVLKNFAIFTGKHLCEILRLLARLLLKWLYQVVAWNFVPEWHLKLFRLSNITKIPVVFKPKL